MARKCNLKVYNAVKDVLGKEEAEQVVKELKRRAIERANEKAETLSESLAAIAKEMEEKEIRANKIRRRNQLINFKVWHNIFNRLSNFKNDYDGMNSLLDGLQTNIKEGRLSTVAIQRSYASKIINALWADIEENDLVSTFHDKSLTEELANELFQAGSSKNDNVAKLASFIKKYNERLVKDLNKHGADISIIDDYIARQSHDRLKMLQPAENVLERRKLRKFVGNDSVKLREMAYTRWRNTILPLLNPIETFQGADPEEFLKSAYDAMTSGVRKIVKDVDTLDIDKVTYSRSSDLAGKLSRERVFIFKDGTSWLKYNKIYGQGDMRSAILNGFMRGSENLGLLKIWGPNPEAMFKSVMDEIKVRNRANPDVFNKLHRLENTFAHITGTANLAVDPKLARRAGALRRLQSITKLGGVLISSFPDVITHAATLKYNGMGFLDSYANALGAVFKGMAPGEQKKVAELIGIGAEHLLGETAARFSAEDSASGVLSSLERAVFKYQGMTWWDEAHRSGAGVTLSRWLAMNKDLKFEALEPKLKNALGLYGIGDKEWSIISKATMQTSDGKHFITPDKLPDITRVEAARMLGKDARKVTSKDLAFIKEDVEEKLRSYFYDQIDHVILNARPSDRASILGASQPGEAAGEALRFIAQFKMYSLAFYRRIIMREINGTFDGKPAIQNLTEIVLGATALGYISNATKDILNGKTPEPFGYQTVLRAMERGGGLGIMGDMLFGDFGHYGRGALESVFGPVAGTVADTVNLMAKARDLDDPRMSAFYLAKSNIPFLNLWYTKTPLNYMLLWGIQERISPGHTRRMVRRAENNNQHYFINPMTAANLP